MYNESENIADLYLELAASLGSQPYQWNVVFVDDGSADGSLDAIRHLARSDSRINYLSFHANCGQSAAFAAGFQFADGDVFVTMDADLQNDPADIPAMLAVRPGGGYGHRVESQAAGYADQAVCLQGCQLGAQRAES